MLTEKTLAVVGVFLLVVGMFLPIWRDSFDDTTSDLIDIDPENNIDADGPGIYFLILAAVALFLLIIDRAEYTWVTTLLTFLPLFLLFAGSWSLTVNDLGSLEIGWLVILGGLLLMGAPFWPERLKTYLSRVEMIDDDSTPDRDTESIQEEAE